MTELNVKSKSKTLLEDNTERNLGHLGLDEESLDMRSRAQSIKEKMIKCLHEN